MNPEQISIIIPCYNEGRRLPVAEFIRFSRDSPIRFVFVDDGSRDNTGEVLAGIRSTREDRITVLKRDRNQGKAEAVRTGINFALEHGARYVGFWDADLATPLASIPHFLQILDERPSVEMVFGARVKLLGRKITRRPARHYLGRVFATAVSTVLHLPIYDSQCGAKIFRVGPGTRDLFDDPFQSRWIFDVELIARHIRAAGSPERAAEGIYEYPLHQWTDVSGSKVTFGAFFTAFWDLARIYWLFHQRRS